MLAGRTAFEASGRRGDADLLIIEQARLANPAAEVTLSGELNLRSLEADLRAQAELADDRLIAGLIAGAGSERLLLEARWHGPLLCLGRKRRKKKKKQIASLRI